MGQWFVVPVAAILVFPAAALGKTAERTIEISVTAKGFEPAQVKVAKGEPLKLVVTRKTDQTCATKIVIPSEKISADLPLNKPVTLRFTPRRAGEIKYACGMDMITGVIEVASNSTPAHLGAHAQATNDARAKRARRTGGMSCGCRHGGSASDDS